MKIIKYDMKILLGIGFFKKYNKRYQGYNRRHFFSYNANNTRLVHAEYKINDLIYLKFSDDRRQRGEGVALVSFFTKVFSNIDQ